jgi:hypothetical protein
MKSPLSVGTSGSIFPPNIWQQQRLSKTTLTTDSPDVSAHTSRRRLSIGNLNVPSSTVALYTADGSNNFGADIEPSLISFTNGSIAYTADAYSHWDGTNYRVQASTFSNLTSSSSTPLANYTFPLATGLNESGDPTVAANPYTTGVRPGALYASFFTGYRANANAPIGNPMQIIVWGSDDGGQTWNSSSIAAASLTTDNFTLDKPVMDVSWYAGTLGYIYVAWTEIQASGVTRIMLRRNTGGLWQRCHAVGGGGCVTSWGSPIVIADYTLNENPVSPQVVVSPDNGDVYVFWLNWYGQIRLNRFIEATQAWSGPITVAQSINRITGNNGILPNGLRALVNPVIKYNTAAHRVMAVWHDRTLPEPTNETALYYASFDASTINGPVTAAVINDASGSQIQPAIDNDDAGNMLVTYFTTEGYGTYYRLFGLCLNSAGFVSCTPAAVDGSVSPNAFIGDYHENFFWSFSDGLGSRWNTSWSSTNANYDALITGVH